MTIQEITTKLEDQSLEEAADALRALAKEIGETKQHPPMTTGLWMSFLEAVADSIRG